MTPVLPGFLYHPVAARQKAAVGRVHHPGGRGQNTQVGLVVTAYTDTGEK